MNLNEQLTVGVETVCDVMLAYKSAKERTMLHAIKTGKIQSGEAKLKGLRLELEEIFGMDVDISIIKIDGSFDNPPFIPFE